MTTARSGAGDPARTIALLWRHAMPAPVPSRGPRQGLDVDAVVSAAIGLADAEGPEAVTMRRVAAALSVGPMTLYTYVPSRDELIDLMLDEVYAEQERERAAAGPEDPRGQPTEWRDRVGAVLDANRALLERHPWAASVDTMRPTLGPGAIARYDRELGAFDGLGLDDVAMDAALSWALAFVRDWARTAESARRLARDTALDEGQWWAAAGPVLAQVLDPSDYPLAGRVGQAAGAAQGAAWVAGRAYEFGRERVLDGLAALIDARA